MKLCVRAEAGAEGVIGAFADFIGGFTLWIDAKGHLIHTDQYLGIDTCRQTSTAPVPSGEVQETMFFEADEPEPGTGGNATLWANGRTIGEGRMPKTVSLLYATYAAMGGVGHGAAG